MADDTDAGLSVRQLLKMVASGDLRAVLYVFGKPDFHIWSRLREFGAHIPDPDLESFKTRLSQVLILIPALNAIPVVPPSRRPMCHHTPGRQLPHVLLASA